MTDSASRDPDQLASDLADGLLPPDEAARLRADPAVAARVARIEALRSALRSTPPVPPPPGALDRMVAVAVDAASSPGSASSSFGQPGVASGPRPLQAVRPPVHHAPPTPRARSVAPWLAAAAAVLVGLAMAGLLVRGGSSSDDDMATSAQDSAGEESADESGDVGAAGGSGSPDSQESDEPSATSGPRSPGDGEDDGTDAGDDVGVLSSDLGAVASATELADQVRADRAAGTGEVPPTPSEMQGASCPALRPAGDPARGSATYFAQAEYQGQPVVVHVYETGAGARLVATDASCLTLVDVAYQD